MAALGTEKAKTSGRATVAQMKAMLTDDPLSAPGSVRSDGRKIHDTYIFQVKTPEESCYPSDYYRIVRRVPAAESIRPLAEGHCELTSTQCCSGGGLQREHYPAQ